MVSERYHISNGNNHTPHHIRTFRHMDRRTQRRAPCLSTVPCPQSGALEPARMVDWHEPQRQPCAGRVCSSFPPQCWRTNHETPSCSVIQFHSIQSPSPSNRGDDNNTTATTMSTKWQPPVNTCALNSTATHRQRQHCHTQWIAPDKVIVQQFVPLLRGVIVTREHERLHTCANLQQGAKAKHHHHGTKKGDVVSIHTTHADM